MQVESFPEMKQDATIRCAIQCLQAVTDFRGNEVKPWVPLLNARSGFGLLGHVGLQGRPAFVGAFGKKVCLRKGISTFFCQRYTRN